MSMFHQMSRVESISTNRMREIVVLFTSVIFAVGPILNPYVLITLADSVTIKVLDLPMILLAFLSLLLLRKDRKRPQYVGLFFWMLSAALLTIVSFVLPAENRSFALAIKSSMVYLAYATAATLMWTYWKRQVFIQVVVLVSILSTTVLIYQFVAVSMDFESVFDGRLPFLALDEYAFWAGLTDAYTGTIRVHSLFQEPSYYGIYVIPAFAWSVQNKKHLLSGFFLVGIAISSSILAILSVTALLIFMAAQKVVPSKRTKGWQHLLIGSIAISAVLLLLYWFVPSVQDVLNNYADRIIGLGSDLKSDAMGSTRWRLIGHLPRFAEYNGFFKLFGVGTNQYSSFLSVFPYSNVAVLTVLNYGVVGFLFFIFFLTDLFRKTPIFRRVYWLSFVLVCFSDHQWISWYFLYLMSWCLRDTFEQYQPVDFTTTIALGDSVPIMSDKSCTAKTDDDCSGNVLANSLPQSSLLLSFVIPAYNVEKYISRTLDSILEQNSQLIEIIVVDDASTDSTRDIVTNRIHNNAYRNLRLIEKKVNEGVSSARNSGTKVVRGRYLLYLDGDDFIQEGFVDEVLRALKNGAADVIFWPYDWVNEDDEIIKKFPYSLRKREISGIDLLYDILLHDDTWICTGSAAFRTDMLQGNSLGYNEGCVAGEDVELIFSALSVAKTVHFVSEARMSYVQRKSSATHQFSIRMFDSILALVRVRNRFFSSGNSSLIELAQVVERRTMVANYIGVFTTSLTQLKPKHFLATCRASCQIEKALDEAYPYMRKTIKKLLAVSGNYHRMGKVLLFRISKVLYFYADRAADSLRCYWRKR